MTLPAPADRSAALDLMRALASQAVVCGHYFALIAVSAQPATQSPTARWLWKIIDALCVYSHEAVIVFFMLSGVLVGGRVLADARAGGIDLASYYARRIARLYSVIVPGLALTGLCVHLAFTQGHGAAVIEASRPWFPAWFDSAHSNSAGTLLCNLAGLQMIACYQYGHNLSLWSLSNELIYYLAFPSLLLLAMVRTWRARAVHAGVLAVALALMLMGNTPNDPDRSIIYLNGFLIWCLGAVSPNLISHWRAWSALPRVLCWCALLGLAWAVTHNAGSQHVRDLGVAGLVLATLAWPADAASALPAGLRRVAAFLSDCSYSLYFIHLPVLLLVLGTLVPPGARVSRDGTGAVVFALSAAAASLAAIGFWFLFERRYRTLGNVLVAWARAAAARRPAGAR